LNGWMYRGYRRALGLGLLCLAVTAAPAVAAEEFPYLFEPVLSLIGECSTSGADPIEDPGCPGGTHPPGGRFKNPKSIAIDAYGDEYVASYGDGTNGRIDVFDDEGFFITELADPYGPNNVAVDSKGNLYVFEFPPAAVARYEPSVYKPETGEIKYEKPRVLAAPVEGGGNRIALDPANDHLLVDENNAIKIYGSAGEGNKLLNTITDPKLRGSLWAAVDGQRRRLFASYCKDAFLKECGVLVFEADPPYNLLEEIDGSDAPTGKFLSKTGWLSIAVNEANGHFFVDDLAATKRVYEFDQDFNHVATVESEAFFGGDPLQIAVSNSPLNPSSRNLEYLFVPVLSPGRALAFEPPTIRPPKIESISATNIGETEAELQAKIDPEGGDTEYTIEVEGPGLEGSQVVAEGTISGTSPPRQVSGFLGGLEPGATYSFHVFAENAAGHVEADSSFAAYSDAPKDGGPCPNQNLRSGASAGLPDCRAYELVTPANTNGRPVNGAGVEGDRFAMVQASPLGSAVSFEVAGGILPGSEGTGGFHGDPYRATRGLPGWSTALVGPTGTEASQPQPGSFAPEQGYFFWVASGKGSAVIGGQDTHYVRYPDGHSELVGQGSEGTDPRARGRLITEGGTHVIFETFSFPSFPAIQLEPNAPPTGINAVYDRTDDQVTHVVSLLPGDVTPAKDSAYRGASADGSGIAFENEGILYLRLNNATTFQIGSKGAVFAGVSEAGKRVFYLEGGDLLAFDTASDEVIEFTETGDAVPVNVAPDGNRAYFVSEEEIPGSGPNPNGDEPQSGEQNLYRSDEGAISFVGTVTDRDVEGVTTPSNGNFDGLGLWIEATISRQYAKGASRLTPDGGVFLFQSRANLDGYDSGAFAQIYRYDSAANSLSCLSCPPTKVSATGGAALQTLAIFDVAAPFSPYGFAPNLRADGKRAFFESTEALVSSDTDEVRDVYEWEEAGVGSCTRAGGCIYLISSGHSARNNYLFGHSASGDDVFFTTGDVLVGGDEDTVSVYDARVNGGFAEPGSTPCIDETCRGSASPPPPLTTPSKGAGEGNPPAKTCPRGKRKAIRHGKQVCINKHRKHKKHRRRS
jgi:hypothetical protein